MIQATPHDLEVIHHPVKGDKNGSAAHGIRLSANNIH